MNKQSLDGITLKLTNKQKEAVDQMLLELKEGNPRIRKYKYYYILHKINVNQHYNKGMEATFIGHRYLISLFKKKDIIKSLFDNLICYGIIEMGKNYYHSGPIKRARSYKITEEYTGDLDCEVSVTPKEATYVKHIIKKRQLRIEKYNRIEKYQKQNLLKLSVNAPDTVIQSHYDLHQIHDQNFYVKTHSSGRVSTNMVNLTGNLKQYIRFNGNDIIEIDIANSQPLISSLVFANHFKYELEEDIPDDLIRYTEHCERGEFYETIMKELNIPIEERESFKDSFFSLFYAPNYYKKAKLRAVFEKIYPNISKALFDIKYKDHKQLARDLQAMEAKIIFSVYERIMAKKIPALTIHDSIIVSTVKDAEEVKDLLLQEFHIQYNLRPTLKIKTTNSALNLGNKLASFEEEQSIPLQSEMQPVQSTNTFLKSIDMAIQPTKRNPEYKILEDGNTLEYQVNGITYYIGNFNKFRDLLKGSSKEDKLKVRDKMMCQPSGEHRIHHKNKIILFQKVTLKSDVMMYVL